MSKCKVYIWEETKSLIDFTLMLKLGQMLRNFLRNAEKTLRKGTIEYSKSQNEGNSNFKTVIETMKTFVVFPFAHLHNGLKLFLNCFHTSSAFSRYFHLILVNIVYCDHICFEKSSPTFWQVRCYTHRTRCSCQQ